MKVSEFSVKHPVVITMLLIVLTVFGFYSLNGMVVEFMTDISMPQAIVYTIYPGASAEDIEQDVTKVLEDSFVTLPHFKAVDSSSYNSMSWITITYADGYNPYDQLEELRNRIREIKDQLPEGVQGEPVALVGGITMLPVISFTVSAGQDSARVTEYINDELIPLLTQIDGVSSIEIDGGKELQVNIKLNTDELVSKGISVSQVYQILNYGNVNLPLGTATHKDRTIQVRYAGGFNTIEDIKNLPVGVADENTIIRLSDVAEITLDYPEPSYKITDGYNPLILVSVSKRSDGDTVKIDNKVKKVLKEQTQATGGAVTFHIISDDSRSVTASLKTVIQSGVMSVIFAVLVILLFMADWRTTLAIGLSIPLCILFTFIGLKVTGYSINLMSLSGLIISIGMVVDGSTVMLDQIYRYYRQRDGATGELKYTVNQAIYKGWDEVAGSILASVATSLVVFFPIILLKGLVGDVLSPVAVTISMAIGCSFVVAVVIVPYLLKLLLSDKGPKVRAKPRRFDVFMDKLELKYRGILVWGLKHGVIVIVSAVFLLGLSVFLVTKLGVALFPSTDAGEFYITADFPKGSRIEQTEEKMQLATKLLYDNVPEIDNVIMYIGQGQSTSMSQASPESAYAHVILVPVSERKRDVHDIMLQMQEIWAAALPDCVVNIQNGGFDKLVGYISDGGGYGLTLISEDLEALYETASGIKDFLEDDPDVVNAKLDTNYDTSTMVIDMSQEYLSSLGLTSYETGITSAILFQGIDAGRYKEASTGDRYNIRLFSDITDSDLTLDDIANVHIITDRGQDVSFANLSEIYVENSVSQINHSNRAKKITVTASLVTEDTSGVSARVNEYIASNPLPNGVKSAAGGITALIAEMFPPIFAALFIAVFLVYTVMVIQFEKFRQPFIILATIPFCLIGVILGLMLFDSTVNLLSLLGLISLAGVVVNNGIILIDYVNQLRVQRREELARERGVQNRDGEWVIDLDGEEEQELLEGCVLDGSSSRIRPILITTLTTLLGSIPMAIGSGEGSELYAPMGQAIVGGTLTSTLITLVLIPVIYYLTEHKKTKSLGGKTK